jgi:hypothetical protein
MEASISHLVLLELMVWYHDGITTGVAVKMREILPSSLPEIC